MQHAAAPARPPINWPTVAFLLGTTLAALAWPVFAWNFGITRTEVAMAVAMYLATGLSITVGYHRLVAHRTYRAHPVAETVLLLFGAAAWQGSALEWAVDHIRHHSFIDTEADPYNRRRGFWYSHIGWLFRQRPGVDMDRLPPFLKRDRLVLWQHRYILPISLLMSFALPVLVCGWRGLLLAGAVRIVVVHHTTWLINSWAHTGKRRTYNPNVTANDNWLMALVAFGEGWHNFHHAFPNDYRNGVRRYDWDPSKWIIWGMSRVGLASDLKRTSPSTIWNRRVEALLAYRGSAGTRERLVASTKASLERVIARAEQRASGLAARLHEQAAASQADLEVLRRQVEAKMEQWKLQRDRRSLARARRLEEVLEQIELYRGLLARIAADPAFQAR